MDPTENKNWLGGIIMMVLQTVQMGPKEKQKLTEESSWCRLLKWVPMKNKNWLPGIILLQIFQMRTHEK